MTNTSKELREGYIKVKLDYAPKTNGKKFIEWCDKYRFTYIGISRRAWCNSLSTYFRDAAGVAFNDGEMFLFYEDDLVDIAEQVNKAVVEARIDELEQWQANKTVYPLGSKSWEAVADRIATLKQQLKDS